MNRTTIAAALLAFTVTAQAQAAERPEDRWNLADLYPTTEAWREEAARIEARVPSIAQCRGKLGESARRFRDCLELRSEITRHYYRLALYAGQLAAEDTGNAANLSLQQSSRVLGAKLNEATAFMDPEILALGKPRVEAFLREEPQLAPFRQPLDNILRNAPHTLDLAGEELVAKFQFAARQSGSLYSILANADMPWPTVKLADGREARLDQSGYEKARESANREDRKKVMDAFFGKWKEFERTMGVAYYGSLKEDAVYTRVRKYPDSLTRALDGNKVPRAVYDTLIASANANLPTLHRYFKLRARMLGLQEMRYYDIYPPLVGGGRQYPLDEGVAMMLAAVKPLGERYVAELQRAVTQRWMDVYPRPRKQSGAHMAGYAYDVHPYLLLNYSDNYASVSTLAHEWGHAMHSWFSNKAQPFPIAGYAIFTAEIASTVNEALLLDHALKTAKSDDERLIYLGTALEGLRGTFFRQSMFAEFEQRTHAEVDAGKPLTGADLTRIYGELLRRYHGDAAGVVKIDDLYAVEWAYIPHFYSAFYVFQYATSISAGSLFAQSILGDEPGARDRYLKLISSGGSDYPYELVKAAGVDLATRAPYDAVASRMNRIMDEMEAILVRRGGQTPASK